MTTIYNQEIYHGDIERTFILQPVSNAVTLHHPTGDLIIGQHFGKLVAHRGNGTYWTTVTEDCALAFLAELTYKIDDREFPLFDHFDGRLIRLEFTHEELTDLEALGLLRHEFYGPATYGHVTYFLGKE